MVREKVKGKKSSRDGLLLTEAMYFLKLVIAFMSLLVI